MNNPSLISRCADCNAVLPNSETMGLSGYAITSVPRFTEPRERIIGCNGSNRGTVFIGAGAPHGERGTLRFPAAYDVEGDDRRFELVKKLSATDKAAAAPERRICYQCCATLDREAMTVRGLGCLYLVEKPADETDRMRRSRRTMSGWQYYRYELTNWPGSVKFRLTYVNESFGYGFGRRYPVRTFRFIGPDGYYWSGRNAGDNQLARCKRTRDKLSEVSPQK